MRFQPEVQNHSFPEAAESSVHAFLRKKANQRERIDVLKAQKLEFREIGRNPFTLNHPFWKNSVNSLWKSRHMRALTNCTYNKNRTPYNLIATSPNYTKKADNRSPAAIIRSLKLHQGITFRCICSRCSISSRWLRPWRRSFLAARRLRQLPGRA